MSSVGSCPPEIGAAGRFAALRVLRLQDNGFSGAIPAAWGAPWPHAPPAALPAGYTYYDAATMHLSIHRTQLLTCDECATASERSRFGGALAAARFDASAASASDSADAPRARRDGDADGDRDVHLAVGVGSDPGAVQLYVPPPPQALTPISDSTLNPN